ncbi:2-isopropylmalate synthase [Egibacter rhizosphaerae]|uniref:2-isopropylmalate synthase n=1 Tax=Egibacter rhizosphaerae TaxID=1670831 RepID=A0A411YCV8_9ACTN|nr:2-isopropylmalate synthase [Egibacter rhizosphaerae]QBI19026.1 2-isopropylmalate synthase [Egibacter rhizosphaerae]
MSEQTTHATGAPVRIFDTTLRDGEQAPGISLDVKEKLEIAEQLGRLGVDIIEGGFPITSQGDFDAVKAIAETVGAQPLAQGADQPPVIAALARCHPDDIKRAADAVGPAQHGRIHVFLSTSEIHRHVLHHGASEDEIVAQAVEGIQRAREFTDDVEFSPQDATRTDDEFLKRIVDAAVEAGATTVNIPDTVGYAIPHDFGATIGDIVRRVGPEVAVSVHCHNDLGLAVANSIEAVRHGATQVEVAVNGIGERAGNCSLEEVVMALATREDVLGRRSRVRTREIGRASRLVSTLTGYPVQFNKAVVGKNAFAHESGIHQHGVLQDRLTYEIMSAEDVGLEGRQIVLGKHSGRHAFSAQLEEMGYDLTAEETKRAFERFKELADKKVEVTDADLEALVADEVFAYTEEAFELDRLEVTGGTVSQPEATVVVRRTADASIHEETATGDGMVDAACGAIRQAVRPWVGATPTLVNFNVAAVTKGIDALGDVTVQVEVDDQRYTGRAVSTDVVEASARAFLAALNKSMRLQRARDDAARSPMDTP